MGTKKTFQWLLIFSALATFSFVVVTRTNLSLEATMAKAFAAEPKLARKDAFIIVADAQEKMEARRSAYRGFFKQFRELFRNDEICGLTQGQLQEISTQFPTSTETVTVNGKSVTMVKVRGDEIRKQALETMLRQQEQFQCRMLEFNRILYMLLSTHLS